MHGCFVAAVLIVSAVLAVRSLLGDSITFDEPGHLASGYCCLKTGDYRLSPDHPPLSRMWAALPLLWTDNRWPPPETDGWRQGDAWKIARAWLFERNDGERLIVAPRCMMVVLFLLTCLCVYAMTRALFGPTAGLLAIVLAAFDPSLLAHGRYVTTDLPATLCGALTLMAFARLLNRVTPGRVLLVGLALASFGLVKLTWPLVLPALLLMAVIAILRPAPLPIAGPFAGWRQTGGASAVVAMSSRMHRTVVLAVAAVAVGLVVWIAIWACYGFRYSPFRGADAQAARMIVPDEVASDGLRTMADSWAAVLPEPSDPSQDKMSRRIIRFAKGHRLLPEAYLYGLAYAVESTGGRLAYLMGQCQGEGWLSYFPIAFAIKTPIATMLLLVTGIAALCLRRTSPSREPALFAGLICFTVLWGAVAVTSRFNIGHRHILPMYPAVFVLAGAAAAWVTTRVGRLAVIALVMWLVAASLWIHPHYLAYFNELIGGPANGYKYLVDSNIDWGQDLKRLARYAKQHPNERIKLAYLGSAVPSRYGFDCEFLPSTLPIEAPPATLDAGTYVISVTQLVGVYSPTPWDSRIEDGPAWVARYAQLYRTFAGPASDTAPALAPEMREPARKMFEAMRPFRLLYNLRRRKPDDRIGYSMLVYRLSRQDVDAMLRP